MMEPFIGEVSLFPYEFELEGWARCNGQLFPIKHHMELFSLIGTRFGGDVRTTFALPKIPPLPTGEAAALDHFICIKGIWPPRR